MDADAKHRWVCKSGVRTKTPIDWTSCGIYMMDAWTWAQTNKTWVWITALCPDVKNLEERQGSDESKPPDAEEKTSLWCTSHDSGKYANELEALSAYHIHLWTQTQQHQLGLLIKNQPTTKMETINGGAGGSTKMQKPNSGLQIKCLSHDCQKTKELPNILWGMFASTYTSLGLQIRHPIWGTGGAMW